jgi:hypothetical protein
MHAKSTLDLHIAKAAIVVVREVNRTALIKRSDTWQRAITEKMVLAVPVSVC